MTKLLYYQDSYQVEFRARVIERIAKNGRHGIILDRTRFYPTSGGQPSDRGFIDDLPIEEVLVRDEDGQVVHYMSTGPSSGPLLAAEIHGLVDWPRRFDHMQQHTGQHILSQAFERVAGATTVGFHMGAEASTLDLDVDGLAQEQLDQTEALANGVVWENLEVTIKFVTEADALQLPLRKIPPARDGMLRLVSVDSFDLSACGGTHVRGSGEIGIIKIVKMERAGGKCRVEFLCGNRALGDYGRKNLILARLSSEMTTGYWELENSVARLRDDLKQTNRALKRKNEELIRIEADSLVANAADFEGVNVIRRQYEDRDPSELRKLASRLVGNERTIVLFGLAGPKAQLLFARSDDLQIALNEILAKILPLLGNATGGGSPKFAQGGGPPAKNSDLQQVLAAAENLIQDTLTMG